MTPLSDATLSRRRLLQGSAAVAAALAMSRPLVDIASAQAVQVLHLACEEPQTFDPGTPGYLHAVYDDASLITQYDTAGTATSASSQPSVMAAMLTALGDLPPHTRVLEIGTGTGYNAALLSHKVGDHAVTSIDIDPRLTDHARTALHRAGYAPTLLTGDGTSRHADSAPYDRLIATCGVNRVPPAWLAQVRPGGVIVANLGLALVALHVTEDGAASGPLLPTMAAFMTARPTPHTPAPAITRDVSELLAAKGKRTNAPYPNLADDMPQLLRSLLLPDVEAFTLNGAGEDTQTMHCLIHRPSGSWARVVPQHGGTVQVDQGGPRNLFDEGAQLVLHWARAGRPGPERYGLSVGPDGRHELWFETRNGPNWLLP